MWQGLGRGRISGAGRGPEGAPRRRPSRRGPRAGEHGVRLPPARAPGTGRVAGHGGVRPGAVLEAFADPEVAPAHVRAVEYGCFLFEVRRG